MNVLVIGGTRFMGRHLVTVLLANSHNVTIANRGKTADDFGDRVQRIVVDRADEDSIKANLSHLSYDVVFDSLAYCSNDVKILLDNIHCDHYVAISTTAIYNKHMDTKEDEFDPLSQPVVWCKRPDFPYDEIKRQAERALAQAYNVPYTAVRFPFVVGKDDYTNRLFFYVKHIIDEQPMFIDNYENPMAFVRSDEAGRFLAFFAENGFRGGINGASEGTISMKDVAGYVKSKTSKQIILSDTGDVAPYNGQNAYSINTDKAQEIGFSFTPLHDWIYDLLDHYIETATDNS